MSAVKVISINDLIKSASKPSVSSDAADCFIVSNNQFNAILCNVLLMSDIERTAFIRNLVTLNVLAYNHRYPDAKESLSYGAKYQYSKPSEEITALQSLKFLNCLEFQLRPLTSHDEYPDFKRIATIKDQLVRLTDGYGAMRWSIK